MVGCLDEFCASKGAVVVYRETKEWGVVLMNIEERRVSPSG